MRLVLASLNAHKLTEIRALLAGLPLDVVGLDAFPAVPEPPETGATFEDNALQKAVFVAEATGLPALADDSGLAVDALGGAPGVHSKRFSPEGTAAANNALLLARLAPHTDRRARFVCMLALAGPAGRATVRGECPGTIGQGLVGDGGFGYDPLFWPDEAPGRSMAQLSLAEKNAISHRGRAFAQLGALLSGAGLGRVSGLAGHRAPG